MSTRKKINWNTYKPAKLGRIPKREVSKVQGLYGVIELINDLMDKRQMSLTDISLLLPHDYTSLCSIYHNKRSAPSYLIVSLANELESGDTNKIVVDVLAAERILKPLRVAEMRAARDDPVKIARKLQKKKIKDAAKK